MSTQLEMVSTASAAPAPEPRWLDNNVFALLVNGEQYFPAVCSAIAEAQREVVIETFILFDDEVGRQLQQALIEAARRGVSIDLTVDGFGSPDLDASFLEPMITAGVRVHVFEPGSRLFGKRVNIFRRLHRKLVAVDGRIAFIGGINYSADHLLSYGPKAKQDFATRIEGPLAADIHDFVRAQIGRPPSAAWWRRFHWRRARAVGSGRALFVWRDNHAHRDDIERHYRIAIRSARQEILIANAYFFPGYRLLKQLRGAARRGVSVKLILQGEPDMQWAKFWADLLYPPLLNSGVEIYEYMTRPLHAKIAAVDGNWCTIGSSNLDPLSLALNLEANVIVRDEQFVSEITEQLRRLLGESRRITHVAPARNRWRSFIGTLGYHATRYFPRLALWLPARSPVLKSIEPGESESLVESR